MSGLRYCPHCGYWLLTGSVVEREHGPRCRKAPKPKRGPSKRQRLREALRRKLTGESTLFEIIVKAREGIHPHQLRDVADGRSDFAPSTWRRLEPYLNEPAPSQSQEGET